MRPVLLRPPLQTHLRIRKYSWGVVQAHVFLERAQPAVGSVLQQSPRLVRLWFSDAIKPALSRVRVFAIDGDAVATGGIEVDPSVPGIVSVSINPLPAGVYKVVWRVVAPDAHVSEGDFSFRVGK